MALFDTTDKKYGYGQIEPNRCSFLHDGNVESQCRADEDLENGWIVRVDKAAGTVVSADSLEGLVGICYTAERIYERATGLKNFYTKKDEYPRVGYLKKGDVYTTNAITTTMTSGDVETSIASGLYISAPCGLTDVKPDGEITLKVVALTDLPDGAPAVKVQVI